jgi:hypothetical protein
MQDIAELTDHLKMSDFRRHFSRNCRTPSEMPRRHARLFVSGVYLIDFVREITQMIMFTNVVPARLPASNIEAVMHLCGDTV